MKYYPNHNGRQIPWPNEWPEPLRGANAGPLAGNIKHEAMKEDIKKRGLREKIKLTKDGKLAEGRNRYRALRELGWSHERVLAEAVETIEKQTDNDAAMSNIMRVNRTNSALIASYLITNPKALETILKDRKGHGSSKSGQQAKIAAIVGCSPKVVQRMLDNLEKEELRGVERQVALEIIAADNREPLDYTLPRVEHVPFEGSTVTMTHSTGEVAGDKQTEPQREQTEQASNSTAEPDSKYVTGHISNSQEQETNNDRRVRVTPEKEKKIRDAYEGGKTNKSEIARCFDVSETTVRNILKKSNPNTEKKKEEDKVEKALLSLWTKYSDDLDRDHDHFFAFIEGVYKLANLATISVAEDTWLNMCKQQPKSKN